MALGACVRVILRYNDLPFYPHAMAMYKKGETTGSNKANRALTENCLKIGTALSRHEEELLFDPQTSGGLLLALPGSQTEELVSALAAAGVAAVRVGEVGDGQAGVEVV